MSRDGHQLARYEARGTPLGQGRPTWRLLAGYVPMGLSRRGRATPFFRVQAVRGSPICQVTAKQGTLVVAGGAVRGIVMPPEPPCV